MAKKGEQIDSSAQLQVKKSKNISLTPGRRMVNVNVGALAVSDVLSFYIPTCKWAGKYWILVDFPSAFFHKHVQPSEDPCLNDLLTK
jgi:hypothetical protein